MSATTKPTQTFQTAGSISTSAAVLKFVTIPFLDNIVQVSISKNTPKLLLTINGKPFDGNELIEEGTELRISPLGIQFCLPEPNINKPADCTSPPANVTERAKETITTKATTMSELHSTLQDDTKPANTSIFVKNVSDEQFNTLDRILGDIYGTVISVKKTSPRTAIVRFAESTSAANAVFNGKVHHPYQNLALSKYIDRDDRKEYTIVPPRRAAGTRHKLESEQIQQDPKVGEDPPGNQAEGGAPPALSDTITETCSRVTTGSSQPTKVQWAIHLTTKTGSYQTLKFFLKWFESRMKGADRVNAVQLQTPSPEFIIPFLKETDLAKAVELGKDLMAGDPSIQIKVWTPATAQLQQQQQYEPNITHTAQTTIFVRNIRTNQFDSLKEIFSDFGQINKVTKTSERTALINFCKPEDMSKALSSTASRPHANLSWTRYKENNDRNQNMRAQNSKFPVPTLSSTRTGTNADATNTLRVAADSKSNPTFQDLRLSASSKIQDKDDKGGINVSKSGNEEQRKDGEGGMDNSISNSPASGTQTRSNPSQWYIQSKYSQTNDKCWTIDTAFLDKKLALVGLVCAPVQGDGNCGYNAIIKSGDLSRDFISLKLETLNFLQANELNVRLYFHGYGGTSLGEMDDLINSIRASLQTPGNYTDNHCLQLVAWTLQRDICVHDVYDFHELVIHCKLPWTSETAVGRPIHIAYRRHAIFSYFNKDYKPIGKLEGHYWGMVLIQQNTSTPPVQNDNYFRPLIHLTLDNPELGNNQKSVLHRL
jgi:hypothetical protein